MEKEFAQQTWDEAVEDDLRQIVRLAVREDLDRQQDWTTLALTSLGQVGSAAVVAREPGTVCGLAAARVAVSEMDTRVQWRDESHDGEPILSGQTVAEMSGPTNELLVVERLILNVLGRLSGVATLTQQFVEAAAGARVYDPRTTTPGWRRLEKYAVRCGGGWNHRGGLFDAILIKDNHLAAGPPWQPADAVVRSREFLRGAPVDRPTDDWIVEVEVDTLAQLQNALSAAPDIVLLDNMSLDELRTAVQMRDAAQVDCELEASGGVTLATIGGIAGTGVERISAGALTHSAVGLDFGLDWRL